MLNKVKFNVRLNIELSRISEDPRNFYETEGGEEIERKNAELMDSIKADGLIHAITLRPDPADPEKFIIISGHRRFKCYQRLAAEDEAFLKIPAVVKPIRDDLKARLMLLEANTTARETTDYEKMEAVKVYGEILDEMKAAGVEMPGRRREHIAAALGMSKTQVGRFEHIEKCLTDENKEELRKGNLGVSVADKLASMPPEKQNEIMEKTGGAPTLADLAERPLIDPPEEEPPAQEPQTEEKETVGGAEPEAPTEPPEEKETDVVTDTPLSIPGEKGWIKVQVTEKTGGVYFSGAEYELEGKHGAVGFYTDQRTGAILKDGEPEEYDTYEEAFDGAIQLLQAREPLAAVLLGEKEEGEREESWSEDEAALKRRVYALKTTREFLEKQKGFYLQLKNIDTEEGNADGAANRAAVVEYIDELIAQINDDLSGIEAGEDGNEDD